MKTTSLVLFAAMAASLFLASCASTGGSSPAADKDSVSASVPTMTEIRAEYGNAFADNPFYLSNTSILPVETDYIVVKIRANSMASGRLNLLQAEAVDGNGKVRASAYDHNEFQQIAQDMSSQVLNQATRHNKVDWFYIPSLSSFAVSPGSHQYILVLGGRHPLPDDLTVIVRVTLNNVEEDFSLKIPPKT